MPSPVIKDVMTVLKDWDIDTRGHSYPDHYMIEDLLWKLDIGVMETKTKLLQTKDWFEIPFRLSEERTLTIVIRGQEDPVPSNYHKGCRHRAKHRIVVVCDCGKTVPMGRLQQHKCK